MQYKDNQPQLTLISLDITDEDTRRAKDQRMAELIDQGFIIASQTDCAIRWHTTAEDEGESRRIFQAVLYRPAAWA